MEAPGTKDGAIDQVDSSSEDMAGEAPSDHPTNCTARFSFEGNALHGAYINTDSVYHAFTSISNNSSVTLCGSGALEIDAEFMGSAGAFVGGEIDIPLNGFEDLSGKTFTINVRSDPPAPITFFVFLVTSQRYESIPGRSFPFRLTEDQWHTASFTFATVDGGVPDGGFPDGGLPDGGLPDGGVPYMWSVARLALEVFSYPGDDAKASYKIYVDEIDIR